MAQEGARLGLPVADPMRPGVPNSNASSTHAWADTNASRIKHMTKQNLPTFALRRSAALALSAALAQAQMTAAPVDRRSPGGGAPLTEPRT